MELLLRDGVFCGPPSKLYNKDLRQLRSQKYKRLELGDDHAYYHSRD
jgi:hypothetical protein